jgi:hypothetical protein
MTQNQILTSSDHHANWEALEAIFKVAKEKEIPLVINGDIIGDYNFEELAQKLNLQFPYEITTKKLQENLEKEELEYLSTFEQLQQTRGNIEPFLKQIPQEHHEKAKEQFQKVIEYIQSEQFQIKYNNLKENILKDNQHIISENKIKLRALYSIIVKEHAKLLTNLIQKYKVETYFVLGNHEPAYFSSLVKEYLEPKNKHLLIDLNRTQGTINVNGINIVAVSNVKALMPFLNELYKPSELNKLFPHQMGSEREILFNNVNQEEANQENENLEQDFDWMRIVKHESFNEKYIDVFFSHGQIGRGSWRDDKHANEMPTLRVAAYLSNLAKITVDGHLHTTHKMTNPLGKQTIRAVGDKAYLLTKNNQGEIETELIETGAPYHHRGQLDFTDFEELNKQIISEIFTK